jgi:hypothetical protein
MTNVTSFYDKYYKTIRMKYVRIRTGSQFGLFLSNLPCFFMKLGHKRSFLSYKEINLGFNPMFNSHSLIPGCLIPGINFMINFV